YVAAARMSRDAGCDFIDLKQCHRYLLNELLGARTRPGKYGGFLENRTRFVRERFRGIRAEVCDDRVLATRMNIFDAVPYRKNPTTKIGEPVDYPRPYRN